MANVRNSLLLAVGSLCVLLALIGVIFPVLPTTPFLLLAAYLFTRSSPRALHWLENNRLFGSYIRNYRAGLGMKQNDKIVTITLLWLAIGFSVFLAVEHRWMQFALVGIAGGVTGHLVRIPTYRPEREKTHNPAYLNGSLREE